MEILSVWIWLLRRKVYFDARTKFHLQNYIDSRADDNPALFVTLDRPNDRLKISGVEIRLRELGKRLHIERSVQDPSVIL